MTFDAARFGTNLQRLRQAKGWSIRDVAFKAGVAKNTVLRLEHGKPSTETVRDKVARALGTFEDLVLNLGTDVGKPYELLESGLARWRPSFFAPARKLPADFDDLIQLPKERARFAELGWISRYERSVVPRFSAEFPGMRMMEIWAANGRPGAHQDVELATAIQGGVRLLLGDDRIGLPQGEGVSFLASIPHDYEPITPLNRGDPPVVVLYVLIPLDRPVHPNLFLPTPADLCGPERFGGGIPGVRREPNME